MKDTDYWVDAGAKERIELCGFRCVWVKAREVFDRRAEEEGGGFVEGREGGCGSCGAGGGLFEEGF